MKRSTAFIKVLFWVCATSFTVAANVFASDVGDYAPKLHMRGDLQCWPSHTNNGNNSGECRSKSDFENDKPPVFWEEYEINANGHTAKLITYWIYYGNQNDCSALGGEHVDDWERLTVHLQDGVLKHVTYNQHNGRYTLDAADVPLHNGTHPILYVGKYAHGNYHDQRSKCAVDGACYLNGNYCFYWKDPRGPGVAWEPALTSLNNLDAGIVFPGSTNPRQRTRPHHDTVCRTDGGTDVALGIGLENTCDRNPPDLRDETLTLEQMAINDLNDVPLLVTAAHGGSGGTAFDDRDHIPADGLSRLERISVRSGHRIDQIEMGTVSGNGNSVVFTHGGEGGSSSTLNLNSGETLQSVEMHVGRKDGSDRIFYLKFTTSQGRTLSAGRTTSQVYTVSAQAGYQLIATYGRAGGEVDRLGFVMIPE